MHCASIAITPRLNVGEAWICVDQRRLHLFRNLLAHPMTVDHMLYWNPSFFIARIILIFRDSASSDSVGL